MIDLLGDYELKNIKKTITKDGMCKSKDIQVKTTAQFFSDSLMSSYEELKKIIVARRLFH